VAIQNPPALPAVLAARLASLVNGSKLLVDWHNLGFSMFTDRHGPNHPLVRLARCLERLLVASADFHICVSAALQGWLCDHFSVRATVLYDRPPAVFFASRALSAESRHEVLTRAGLSLGPANANPLFPHDDQEEEEDDCTIQTQCLPSGEVVLLPLHGGKGSKSKSRRKRTALLVSATSWTPDEDFWLLLAALQQLDAQLSSSKSNSNSGGAFDRLAVVITGKGPGKAAFVQAVQDLQPPLRHVAIRTAWLEPGDYPLLLACCDVGVSLHTSTSGLDLPMKVLDMFGAGLPVAAFRFPALPELVREQLQTQHGDSSSSSSDSGGLLPNGVCFSDAPELAAHLQRLLFNSDSSDSGGGSSELAALAAGARQIDTWATTWQKALPPLLEPLLRQHSGSGSKSGGSSLCGPLALVLVLLAAMFALFAAA
jgi:beta-1,4-mannosyltransferase